MNRYSAPSRQIGNTADCRVGEIITPGDMLVYLGNADTLSGLVFRKPAILDFHLCSRPAGTKLIPKHWMEDLSCVGFP